MAGRHRLEGTSRRTSLLRVLAVLAVAAAVVAVILIVRSQTTKPAGEKAAPTPTASASATPTASIASPTPAPRRATTAPAKPRRHTLVLTVTGSASYIDVRVPGRPPLLANVYPHGSHFVFDQRVLDVVLGDAGAVRLEVNGRVKAPAGRPGQVLRFRATRAA